MPNKNDLSDLAKFSAWLTALVFAAAFLFWCAAARAEAIFGDDVRAAAAKISEYFFATGFAIGKVKNN